MTAIPPPFGFGNCQLVMRAIMQSWTLASSSVVPEWSICALDALVHRELLLVAIADLRGVVLDHLADELPVHRAHHDRSARRDVHVAVALLAEVPGAGSSSAR